MPRAEFEQALKHLRAGAPVIVVDDESRENEGDFVVAAQNISADAVNFMITHGRGLLCLALAAEIVDRLELPPMSVRNETRLGTAFTVSIEAREGVSTGISAYDRAHTMRTAARADVKPRDLISPGHVFPLRARPQGLRERQGHTEAGVELMMMAGLRPAAAICEILASDGRMARRDDLLDLAERFALPILSVGEIADQLSSRRAHESV